MNTNTMTQTVNIVTSRMGDFSKRIDRINKLAGKLGVPAVTVAIQGTREELDEGARERWIYGQLVEMRKYRIDPVAERKLQEETPEFYIDYTTVLIEGETPKLPNNRFIAKIDSEGIVYSAPDSPVDVPQSLVERRGECDHCQVRRGRIETFVVQNEVSGELILVGRQCLGDYLGNFGNDPHSVWKFQIELDELGNGLNESAGSFGKDAPHRIAPLDVLASTYQVIKVYDWTPASVAYNSGGIATANQVREILYCCPCKPATELRDSVESVEVDVEYIQKALEWAKTLEGDSDYVSNLRKLSNMDSVGYKHIGFVASILSGYDKATERKLIKERERVVREQRPESSWLGEVGQRMTFKGLTLDSTKDIESNWGYSYLRKFIDADGNEVVWFASDPFNGSREWEIGQTYDLLATVKAHKDWKGRKSTQINRAKDKTKYPSEEARGKRIGVA